MGAEELQKKLKKKKSVKKNGVKDSKFVQKEEKLAKAMGEKARKKKKFQVQTRRSRDEPDDHYLTNSKGESDNADAEKKKNKSLKRKKRKNDVPAETESVEIDRSTEREDGLDQENDISAEVDKHEKRKSRMNKKRKSEKKVGRNGAVDLHVETKEDSKQQIGKPRDFVKIIEKPTEDNLVEKRGQVGEEEIYELSSGDEDCSKGMKKWVTDYFQSRPGLNVLQERIDDFITDYEAKKEQERKEKEARAAEDGWTVVVHHKGRKKTTDSETGIAVGSVSQAAVMDNMAKKKKNDVGLDFYRFQKREAKRNEIMVLQSKFEQDKKRIQQLRAARKFRPY